MYGSEKVNAFFKNLKQLFELTTNRLNYYLTVYVCTFGAL